MIDIFKIIIPIGIVVISVGLWLLAINFCYEGDNLKEKIKDWWNCDDEWRGRF